ncbi:hypothetical protein BGZ54_006851 [Gamsiella multidivaricata]|nr:hypothetical protein BGZ54_006851 [Gamsiella multidivaricata]
MILAVSYWTLPSRRKHPHLIVWLLAITIVLWEALGTVWLHKKEELLCESAYEVANMTNSWLCAVQGIGITYLVLVILWLGLLLITNLHVLAVYRSSIVQTYMSRFMVLAFSLPLAMVIPVVVRKEIMNPGFGSICFVGPNVADAYFFIPLSVIVCLATLMHLGTIGYMIRTKVEAGKDSFSQGIANPHLPVSTKERRLQISRDISLFLKQQWRPGVFALGLLFIDMVYWLFYFVESKKLMNVGPKVPWFQDWISCLGQQTVLAIKAGTLSAKNPTPDQIQATGDFAQMFCSGIARPHVPNAAWAALTDILPSIFGIVVLLIFGSRMELWRDLKSHLFGQSRHEDDQGGENGGGGKYMLGEVTKGNRDKTLEKQQHVPPRPMLSNISQMREECRAADQDLRNLDNFYSDRMNPTAAMRTGAAQGTIFMGNSGDRNLHSPTLRVDTPDPWKLTSLPNSVQESDQYSLVSGRSLTPQLKINTDSVSQPRSTTESQKRFYNTEDLQASPISLITPPPLYIPNNNSNNSRGVSPTSRAHNFPDLDPQLAVVGEASRVRLDYRSNSEIRQFQSEAHSLYYQPQQAKPQLLSRDSSLRSMRAASPVPVRPRKSLARRS